MEIQELRNEIDRVDGELLALFLRRMKLAEQAAEYKTANGLPLLDRERESEILARISTASGDYGDYAYQLFTRLIDLSRLRQTELHRGGSELAELIAEALKNAGLPFPKTGLAACQGTEDGDSRRACDRLLPEGEPVYFRTTEAVLDAVASGLCGFGVLPAEDSAGGSVGEVYELLRKKRLYILRGAHIAEGLQSPDIQAGESGTRYVCVSREPVIYAGADRVGLSLSCEDRPDALSRILDLLAARGVDISRLEYRPPAGGGTERTLCMELCADLREESTVTLLSAMEQLCESLCFLGGYSIV